MLPWLEPCPKPLVAIACCCYAKDRRINNSGTVPIFVRRKWDCPFPCCDSYSFADPKQSPHRVLLNFPPSPFPSAPPSAMRYLIGTDEAGYGPNLGPLVISVSVWQTTDDSPGDNLYERLAGP